MNLNKIIFAAPAASYDRKTFDDELIWVPRNQEMLTQQSKSKLLSKSQEKSDETNQPSKRALCQKIILQNNELNATETQEKPNYITTYRIESAEAQGDQLDSKSRTFYRLLPDLRSLKEYTAFNDSPQRAAKQPRSKSEHQRRRRKYSESSKSRSSSREEVSNTPKSNKKKAVNSFSLFGCMKKKNGKNFGDFSSAKNKTNSKSKPLDGKNSVPCLMLKNKNPSSKILIYFHANSEDLYLCYDLLEHLKKTLKADVIAPEYPGYGVYKGTASESRINADAELIYQYVLNELGFKEEDVILLGRSIGSGPALHLAAKHRPGALILMSSFTSIRAVARARVGVIGQYLVKDRFKNIKSISEVESPTLLIHGRKDRTIPFKYSQKLYDACKATKKIEIRQEMSHNQFDFHDDMSTPILDFLNTVMRNDPLKESNQQDNLLTSCIKPQQILSN